MSKKFVELLKDAAKLEAERGQAYVPADGCDEDGRPVGTQRPRAFILCRNMARTSICSAHPSHHPTHHRLHG